MRSDIRRRASKAFHADALAVPKMTLQFKGSEYLNILNLFHDNRDASQ